MKESVRFDIKVFLITLRLSCSLKQVQNRTSSFVHYIKVNSEEAYPTVKKKCKLNLPRIQRMMVKKLQVKDCQQWKRSLLKYSILCQSQAFSKDISSSKYELPHLNNRSI